jgi:hypothetical protein
VCERCMAAEPFDQFDETHPCPGPERRARLVRRSEAAARHPAA